MKFERKVLVRNLVIAMVVADGAGIYYASQKINQPVAVDDAAREEVARAADTRPIRFTPAPEAQAPALAAAPAAPAAPKIAEAPKAPVAAPIAPARPVIDEAKVAKASLDRFPAPAFGKADPRPAPRVAKAEPVRPAAAPAKPAMLAKAAPAAKAAPVAKPAPRIIMPTLASAPPVKKPVTLSTVVKPTRASHHESFAVAFSSMPAPSVETSLSTGTAGLVTAPEATAVAVQIAPEAAPAPLAAVTPVPAPEILAQPVNPTASVAELPATDGKS